MDMEAKMIDILSKQMELLDEIQTVSELSNWKEKTKIFVCRIYKEGSPQYKQFSKISAYPSFRTVNTRPDIPKALCSAKNILNGFIEDIETFGLPNSQLAKEKNQTIIPNINIENNPNFSQSQIQTQAQSQNIEDIIRDEIPASRMREIEEILKTEEPEKTKLEKVGDVLQKVGIGVTSSVLARIITNSMGIF